MVPVMRRVDVEVTQIVVVASSEGEEDMVVGEACCVDVGTLVHVSWALWKKNSMLSTYLDDACFSFFVT